MSLTVDGFLKHLSDSGVLSDRELLALERKIPAEKRQFDAKVLATELVRIKKLTSFQADTLCEENPSLLILGNYVLQDKIGSGGMGIVYKAQHRRMKRVVAVKVLSQTSIESTHVVKRFLREAETAAKLSHPNIVTAYDADEVNGIPFLAMEYVDGVDLQVHISEHGPMLYETALDCILQAARGLGYAHSMGVIHRDMKPANILLDVHGVAKILDMGLARILEGYNVTVSPESADTIEVSPVTHSGGVCGTVDFMSPEQALDASLADHLSDIYSLGATFYFLLTGQAMYDHGSIMERIVAHREDPLPSVCDYDAKIPRQIDSIFQRMVAKMPSDRYQSMTDLIRDLTHWQKVEITAKSPGKRRLRKKDAKASKVVYDNSTDDR
jgi:serine/threonine-protein kinase